MIIMNLKLNKRNVIAIICLSSVSISLIIFAYHFYMEPLQVSNNKQQRRTSVFDDDNISIIAEISTQLQKEKIKWIPVPDEERQPYIGKCTHPFKHCCIGQCHQIYFHNDPTEEALFVKPTRATSAPYYDIINRQYDEAVPPPLASLSTLLDYINERNIRNLYADSSNTKKQKRYLQQQQQQQQKVTNSTTCNLWFVGDSLAADHIVSAMCQLTQLGYYEIDSCRNHFGDPVAYGEQQFNSICNNTEHPLNSTRTGYIKLQKRRIIHQNEYNNDNNNNNNNHYHHHIRGASSCENILLAYYPIDHSENHIDYDPAVVENVLKDISYNQKHDPNSGGAIIWNWGVHCNEKGCVEHYLNSTFLPFIERFGQKRNNNHLTTNNGGSLRNNNNNRHNNKKSFSSLESSLSSLSSSWTILWKEHEPQHFNIDGGLYPTPDIHGMFNCRLNNNYNNWRNNEAWNFFNQSGLLNVVPIIPIYNSHKPLWNQHYNNTEFQRNNSNAGDCTHYCFSPWRCDVTWNGIYNGLKAFDVAQQLASISL